MAKLSVHGEELIRFFDPRRCMLKAYMADRTVLGRRIGSGWKVVARIKPEVTVEQAVANRRAWLAKQPAWVQKVKSLPSMRSMERWQMDDICETPSGDRVEPDGTGPDGAPSWLVLAGFI